MLNAITSDLERYMDLLSARQKLVASNIANADTPGYRTQDFDFQTEFAHAMSRTATLAESGPPLVSPVNGLAVKNDGNNVNLDREARLLSENALRFSAASNLLRGQLQMVRTAIKEGQGS